MHDHSSNRERGVRLRPRTASGVVLVLLLFVLLAGVAHTQPFAGQQGRDEVRVELDDDGFTPSEVQHPPGVFAIAVDNKILSGEYTLKLKAEDETVLNEFHIQKGSSAWTVNLPTGKYILAEADRPQWTCRIVVQ